MKLPAEIEMNDPGASTLRLDAAPLNPSRGFLEGCISDVFGIPPNEAGRVLSDTGVESRQVFMVGITPIEANRLVKKEDRPSGFKDASGHSVKDVEAWLLGMLKRPISDPFFDPKTLESESNGDGYRDALEVLKKEPAKTCEGCDGGKKIVCGSCGGRASAACPGCHQRGKIECRSCEAGVAICSVCDGTGRSRWGNGACSSCRGSGRRRCTKCNGRSEVKCPRCDGDGSLYCGTCAGAGSKTCSRCDGKGKVVPRLEAHWYVGLGEFTVRAYEDDPRQPDWRPTKLKKGRALPVSGYWVVRSAENVDSLPLAPVAKHDIKSELGGDRKIGPEEVPGETLGYPYAAIVWLFRGVRHHLEVSIHGRTHRLVCWEGSSDPIDLDGGGQQVARDLARDLANTCFNQNSPEDMHQFLAGSPGLLRNTPVRAEFLLAYAELVKDASSRGALSPESFGRHISRMERVAGLELPVTPSRSRVHIEDPEDQDEEHVGPEDDQKKVQGDPADHVNVTLGPHGRKIQMLIRESAEQLVKRASESIDLRILVVLLQSLAALAVFAYLLFGPASELKGYKLVLFYASATALFFNQWRLPRKGHQLASTIRANGLAKWVDAKSFETMAVHERGRLFSILWSLIGVFFIVMASSMR